MHITKLIPSILFLTILPIGAHLAFSALGFNPTDDGVVLAGAERLLAGQVPHKDFISIRPAGSFLFHLPTIILGGKYALLTSRAVAWFQFAFITWCWLMIIWPSPQRRHAFAWFSAVIAFMMTSHNFPLMAWHTLDALFFASCGLWIMERSRPRQNFIGWFLLGISVLARQNFALLLLIIWLLRGRSWKTLVSMALPGMIYTGYLVTNGAFTLAWDQLLTQTSFMQGAIWPYLTEPSFVGAFFIGLMVAYLRSHRSNFPRALSDMTGTLLAFGFIGGATLMLYYGKFAFAPAFGIMGMAGGLFLFHYLVGDPWDRPVYRRAFLCLTVAWVGSISLGYATPALMAGPLFILVYRFLNIDEASLSSSIMPYQRLLVVSLLALCAYGWFIGRTDHIYREQEASKLTYELDEVLPGGAGIMTNQLLHAMFSDLSNFTEGQTTLYGVGPDLAAWWVNNDQKNPLPVDRMVSTELYDQEKNVQKVIPYHPFLLQKYSTKMISLDLEAIRADSTYKIGEWVRENMTMEAETFFFEIYSPQR